MGSSRELHKGSGRDGSVGAFCLYGVDKAVRVSLVSPARVNAVEGAAPGLFIYLLTYFLVVRGNNFISHKIRTSSLAF